MTSDPSPYREHHPRALAPYAAAWREYAWRERFASLLSVCWWFGLAWLVWRFRRAFILVVLVPFPLKALMLRSFRCPRCDQPFGVGPGSSFFGAARAERCVHCGLEKGAPADPDELAAHSHH